MWYIMGVLFSASNYKSVQAGNGKLIIEFGSHVTMRRERNTQLHSLALSSLLHHRRTEPNPNTRILWQKVRQMNITVCCRSL